MPCQTTYAGSRPAAKTSGRVSRKSTRSYGRLRELAVSIAARRFRELLSAAIASGRAHVANPEGGAPAVPEAWGWRQATVGTGNFEREEQRPQGERIGWLEDENLYLEPNAALASVQKQGRDSGDSLAVTGRTLRKRLRERGLLLSTDEARQVLTVRKTLEGKRREVLHISVDFFSLHTEKPNQPDHGNQKAHEQAESTPPLWSGSCSPPDQHPNRNPTTGSMVG